MSEHFYCQTWDFSCISVVKHCWDNFENFFNLYFQVYGPDATVNSITERLQTTVQLDAGLALLGKYHQVYVAVNSITERLSSWMQDWHC